LSYSALAIISVVVSLFLEARVIRSGIFKRPSFYMAYLIVVFFQLLTNSYLTSSGIVTYSPEAIFGFRVANAPVEDLLFGFSLVVLTMAVWVRLSRFGTSPKEKTSSSSDEKQHD
jgi:lycopene cyclase domain-containing protein